VAENKMLQQTKCNFLPTNGPFDQNFTIYRWKVYQLTKLQWLSIPKQQWD